MFLLFTVFACVWFMLYFLFFSGVPEVSSLLTITRTNFVAGIFGVYSLLGFIYFFNTKPTKIFTREV
ncbi:MAG: hypothetical protein ACOYN2_05885 [Patescibacteria group bacterium]